MKYFVNHFLSFRPKKTQSKQQQQQQQKNKPAAILFV
jgi:hypothetical protein